MKLSLLWLGACAITVNAFAIPVNGSVVGIPPELFQEFKHAAQLSLSAFVPRCTAPLGHQKLMQMKASSGYVSLNKMKKTINVVMRGSMSLKDFMTDIDVELTTYNITGSKGCTKCEIQQGLYKAVKIALPDIQTSVRQAMTQNPDYTIIVTGHSLGGSTSQLVALALLEEFGPTKIKLYSLAGFRVGDDKFAKFEGEKLTPDIFYRITALNDGVPRYPPKTIGYIHAGSEYWMQAKQTVDGSQIKVCFQPEDKGCIQQYGESILPVNAAHLKYIMNFFRPDCLENMPQRASRLDKIRLATGGSGTAEEVITLPQDLVQLAYAGEATQ